MHSETDPRRLIPYGRQEISEEDCRAVVAALQSEFLTGGPQVEAFEREFAEFLGARHAVAVCNATAALHLAMRIAEIGPGDRVITSPNTFLSSANCAAFVGATPDFADVEPDTLTLSPAALEKVIGANARAVVAVAHGGQAADMPQIAQIARQAGLIVIEDACHGVGGGFHHAGHAYKLGSHPWADMTVFSFHPVKTMTTGEGGMLVTDNDAYARRARLLRSHGMERDPGRFECAGVPGDALQETGPWVYEMQELGYNYRLTDIQCALGRSQLRRLPASIRRRREIVARYNEAFAGRYWLTSQALRNPADAELVSWHLHTLLIDFDAIGMNRAQAMAFLREHGVGTQVLYIPVYLQPWYRRTYGYRTGKCPQAESCYRRSLSIPLYPSMTDQDVDQVIAAVLKLGGEA